MAFESFRDFVNALDWAGELKRIAQPVATELEITEIANREMKSPGDGKALLFEKPTVNGGQPRMIQFIAMVALGVGLCGCSTRDTVSLAAKTVTTTGSIASKTVLGAGQIAASTSVAVAKAGMGVGAGMAKTGVVTFVDTATGITRQVPYVEGMKLYAASKTAEVDLAQKTIHIMRGTQEVHTTAKKLQSGKGDLPLQPGDVIRLSKPDA
jgi:hypothetical protein